MKFSLVLATAFAASSAAGSPWDYTVEPVAALGKRSPVSATFPGLNDRGMVVGYNRPDGAFRWTSKTRFERVPAASDVYLPRAEAVNNAGVTVGADYFHGNNQTVAIFPRHGRSINLGALLPEAGYSIAFAVSNAGHVAGHYQAMVDGRRIDAAFVWDHAHGMQRIGDSEPGRAPFTMARAVNSAGHVVGLHQTNQSSGFIWRRDTGIVDIPQTIQANSINEKDQVVGQAMPAAPGLPTVAFVADPLTGLTRLPTPLGRSGNCEAFAINDKGHVVGTCYSSVPDATPAHAVLWRSAAGRYQAVDLNELPGMQDSSEDVQTCAALDERGEGYLEYSAVAVNESGQILVQKYCNYYYFGAERTPFGAVLLTPINVPHRM